MKRALVLGMILASGALAQTGGTLTLEDAIRSGLENSKLLRSSAARADAARERGNEASSALLPSVKLEAAYKRLSEVDPFRVQLPGAPQAVEISPFVANNTSLRLTVQQPLFAGFKLRSNARAAEELAHASEADRRNDRADLVLQVTAAYWTLYQAQETRTSVDQNVSRLQSYLRDTESMIKAGLATRNDLLKIQVQLSSARLTQIDAANDVQIGAMNLNNVMGRPLDTDVRPSSRPGDSSISGDPAGTGIDTARGAPETRPDLLAMQSRVEASRAMVSAAQGNWWPQLFLSGSYYFSRPNPRLMPTLDEFRGTWDIGLVLSIDLWNWGLTASQTGQAKAVLAQNEFQFAQMKENVALEVRRARLLLSRAQEKVSVARVSVDQAEENVRMTKDKYKSGLSTSLELLDAELSLLVAQTNSTGALVEREMAKTRLAKASGMLGE